MILVTGATGNVGREVVKLLLDGGQQAAAITRNPAAAALPGGAYGDAATSTIHERDVAAVAVRALVNPAHAGHSYVLTGPQSLTQRDKVRLIGEAIGKELSFEELPPEQLRQAMLAQGFPEDVPERLLGSLADYAKKPGKLASRRRWARVCSCAVSMRAPSALRHGHSRTKLSCPHPMLLEQMF